jgi:hypothetical protein
MISWDSVGYLASMLVLAAFGVKEMIPLRMIAMASNVAFLAYGLALGLSPVWLLHALLLPLNAWRLLEAVRGASAAGGSRDGARATALGDRKPAAASAVERGQLLVYSPRSGRRP